MGVFLSIEGIVSDHRFLGRFTVKKVIGDADIFLWGLIKFVYFF